VLAVLAGYAWFMAPLDRGPRLVVGAVLGSSAVLGALAPVLFFDPVAAGCNACARNLLEVAAAPGISDALQRVSTVLILLWVPTLAALTWARWVGATRLARRYSILILGGTVGMALLTVAAAAMSLRLPTGSLDDVERWLWLGQCVMLVALAAGILLQLLLALAIAGRMTARVIAAAPDAGAVQAWLRDAVDDPELTVTFVRDDGVRVDADGVVVTGDDPRPAVRLSRNGAVFADIRSACRSSQELDLVRACVRSSGLALEYVAARARLRAEAKETVAVRARIVAARDQERRRLERNLHDGAQQRLIALGVMLAAVTRSQADSGSAAYHQEIDAALAELRTVARGLFPVSLGEAGIVAALRELGDHTTAPLLVGDDLAGTVPLPAGMAIYQLVVDASRLGQPASVIQVALSDADLRSVRVIVTVETPVPVRTPIDDAGVTSGRRLIHAEDRFLALGGRLDHSARPGVLAWEGIAPCG
jgi:signal transduction histidine kinase